MLDQLSGDKVLRSTRNEMISPSSTEPVSNDH